MSNELLLARQIADLRHEVQQLRRREQPISALSVEGTTCRGALRDKPIECASWEDFGADATGAPNYRPAWERAMTYFVQQDSGALYGTNGAIYRIHDNA